MRVQGPLQLIDESGNTLVIGWEDAQTLWQTPVGL